MNHFREDRKKLRDFFHKITEPTYGYMPHDYEIAKSKVLVFAALYLPAAVACGSMLYFIARFIIALVKLRR